MVEVCVFALIYGKALTIKSSCDVCYVGRVSMLEGILLGLFWTILSGWLDIHHGLAFTMWIILHWRGTQRPQQSGSKHFCLKENNMLIKPSIIGGGFLDAYPTRNQIHRLQYENLCSGVYNMYASQNMDSLLDILLNIHGTCISIGANVKIYGQFGYE